MIQVTAYTFPVKCNDLQFITNVQIHFKHCYPSINTDLKLSIAEQTYCTVYFKIYNKYS